jgi:hypothetical protein
MFTLLSLLTSARARGVLSAISLLAMVLAGVAGQKWN